MDTGNFHGKYQSEVVNLNNDAFPVLEAETASRQ